MRTVAQKPCPCESRALSSPGAGGRGSEPTRKALPSALRTQHQIHLTPQMCTWSRAVVKELASLKRGEPRDIPTCLGSQGPLGPSYPTVCFLTILSCLSVLLRPFCSGCPFLISPSTFHFSFMSFSIPLVHTCTHRYTHTHMHFEDFIFFYLH